MAGERGGLLDMLSNPSAGAAPAAAPAPAPEWIPWTPPELTPEQLAQRAQEGIGAAPTPEEFGYTHQQKALLGHFGEAERELAGQSLLNYAMNLNAGDAAPTPYPGSSQAGPEMTETANAVIDRQNFPFDPNRLTFDANTAGSPGFAIDNQIGTDFFGGQIPKELGVLNLLPRSMQLFAGPGVSAFYGPSHSLGTKGGAPPWSTFFAPPAPTRDTGQFGSIWPGITHFDAWHRSLGEYPNLYS